MESQLEEKLDYVRTLFKAMSGIDLPEPIDNESYFLMSGDKSVEPYFEALKSYFENSMGGNVSADGRWSLGNYEK